MNAPDPVDTSDTASATPVTLEEAAERYTNRELSWLSFNRRVLAESENEAYPLLERLRFLSISASNLDEFTMVRIAGLEGQMTRGIDTHAIDGRTPRQQLNAIRDQVLTLEDRQQRSLQTLRALLAEDGILIAEIDQLDDEQMKWAEGYFTTDILPLITPQAIDPSHPSPSCRPWGSA